MVTAEHKINRHGSHYVYYHCTRRNAGERCRQPSIELSSLEAQMREFVSAVTIHKTAYDRAATYLSRLRMKKDRDLEEQRSTLDRSIASIDRKMAALTDMRMSSLITDGEFLARRAELEQERQGLREKRANVGNTTVWFEPLQSINLACNRLLSWFVAGQSAMRRAILEFIGSNLTLTDKIISGEALFPILPRLAREGIPVWCRYLDDVRTKIISGDAETLALVRRAEELVRQAKDAGLFRSSDLTGSLGAGKGSGADIKSSNSARRSTIRRASSRLIVMPSAARSATRSSISRSVRPSSSSDGIGECGLPETM